MNPIDRPYATRPARRQSATQRHIAQLEDVYELALQKEKIGSAIKAKELIARLQGLLGSPRSQPKNLMHLEELSDAQLAQFIADVKERG